jgi:signal transduction histidine kinase
VFNVSGDADFHQPEYNWYSRSAELTDSEWYTKESPALTLSIYPTQTFFEVYQTDNPMYAAIVVAVIVVMTTLCSFAIYDRYVRREFHSKQLLLDQKRQFVRYISHEVRTPLNAVCMGLHLIQIEIAQSLGYNDSKALLQHDMLNQNNNEEGEQKQDIVANQQEKQQQPPASQDDQQEKKSWFRLAHDIESNARGSIEILNDLLNYDKIQRGTYIRRINFISLLFDLFLSFWTIGSPPFSSSTFVLFLFLFLLH